MEVQKPTYTFTARLGDPASLPDLPRLLRDQPEDCDQLVIELGDSAWHLLRRATIGEASRLGLTLYASARSPIAATTADGRVELMNQLHHTAWGVVWYNTAKPVLRVYDPRPASACLEEARQLRRALESRPVSGDSTHEPSLIRLPQTRSKEKSDDGCT